MVHHIVQIRLKSEIHEEKIEDLMVESRIHLLKISEVMNLRCGKRINTTENPYHFFFSMDVENMAKFKVVEQSATYLKFRHQVLDPVSAEILQLSYEMEPGKDVRYS